MPTSFQLNILGLDIAFKAEADQKRVDDARLLLEKQYRRLGGSGDKQISKEKLLVFLALGLADDLLQSNQKLDNIESRLEQLLKKIDAV